MKNKQTNKQKNRTENKDFLFFKSLYIKEFEHYDTVTTVLTSFLPPVFWGVCDTGLQPWMTGSLSEGQSNSLVCC